MKIVFFGLGSIGKRHAEILLKNYQHDLYAFRSGVNDQSNSLGIKELNSWSEVEKLKADVAFITNPTFLHIETATACAKIGCKLFLEKPIGKDLKGLDELLGIVKAKKLVTFVAYNLRFHPIILELKKIIEKKKILHARAVCTSYLPNWRPDEDYLKRYSANKEMGGGVILDLSHELDYISYLFGSIKKIEGNYAKRSSLTQDAEDFADILLLTDLAPVNIHINFLSYLRQRYLQIDLENLTIIGDIINAEIKKYENEKLKENFKVEYKRGQEYKEQIKYFFDNIDNPKMMNNLIEAENLYRKIIDFKQNG